MPARVAGRIGNDDKNEMTARNGWKQEERMTRNTPSKTCRYLYSTYIFWYLESSEFSGLV